MATRWDRGYTRREAVGVGAAGLGALYLAACGGDSGSAAGGPDVSVTYDFEFIGKPGSMQRYWKALRTALAESDVDARLTDLIQVNYANAQARYQAAHAAKRGSAIETWFGDWFTYQFIGQDALTPVEDWVDRDLIDGLLFTDEIGGKYWNIPFVAAQSLLVANRAHLAKAGVEVGDRFGSWDDFVSACRKVKRTGETAVMIGASDGFAPDAWSLAFSLAEMDSLKQLGEFTLGELSVDEPVVSKWIDGFHQMYVDGYCNSDAARITNQQGVDRFLDGEGAFAILSPGPVFAQNPDDYRIVGYWDGPGRYAAKVAATGGYAMMTSFGENKEAAGRVLEFMQEPAQLELLHRITGELPCNPSFDTGGLNELELASWEQMTSDPQPTWPRDWVPTAQVNAVFDVAIGAFSGDAPKALKAEYDERMARYRDRNSAEAAEFERFLGQVGDV